MKNHLSFINKLSSVQPDFSTQQNISTNRNARVVAAVAAVRCLTRAAGMSLSYGEFSDAVPENIASNYSQMTHT